MKRFSMLLTVIVMAFLIAAVAVESVMLPNMAVLPHYRSFDSRLYHFRATDPATGAGVPDGPYNLTLSIWDDSTGGNNLWTETQTVVTTDGLAQVLIGLNQPIDLNVLGEQGDTDRVLYLEAELAGETISPRVRLGATMYSNVSSRVLGDVATSPGRLIFEEADTPVLLRHENGGRLVVSNIGSSGQDGVSFVPSLITTKVEVANIGSSGQDGVSIDVDATTSELRISNLGSSGQDGVRMSTDPNSGHLVVSNIGSSGQDGVSIDVGSSSSDLIVSNIGSSGQDGVRMSTTSSSGELVVSNIGSSGQDGVSIFVDDTTSELRLSNLGSSGLDGVRMSTDPSSGHLVVSNIGSSGQDGVSIDVDATTSRLHVSNLGSSGEDGVSIAVDTKPHLEVTKSSVNDTGQTSIGHDHLTISNIGSSGEDGVSISVEEATSALELFLRDTQAQLRASESVELRGFGTFTVHDRKSRVVRNPQTGEEISVSTRLHTDSGATLRVSNIGSSGEDGVSMHVDDTHGTLTVSNIGSSGQDGVSIDVDATDSKLIVSNIGSSGQDGVRMLTDPGSSHLIISNIGSSGEDGVRCEVNDSTSSLRVIPPTAGTYEFELVVTDDLGLMTLDNLGSSGEDGVSLAVDSTGGKLKISNLGSSGEDGVSIDVGRGGALAGGRVALFRQPAGGSVPIELVALSLSSVEPIMVVHSESFQPELPIFELDEETSGQPLMRMRALPSSNGDSCGLSEEGLRIYDIPVEYFYDNDGVLIRNASSSQILFRANSAGELRVQNTCELALEPTSNVGIGVTGPPQKLFVDGNICATGIIGPCSDSRYKKNVATIENAIEIISKLEGVKFDWRTDEFPKYKFNEDRQVGLIAQDVKKVLPEIVTQGDDGYYSVDYSRVAPVLIEAVKEQQKKIETLEAQVAKTTKLEKEIAELKEMVMTLAKAKSDTGSDKLASK